VDPWGVDWWKIIGGKRADARGARRMAMAEREREQICGAAKGRNENDTVDL
jgi:hypothetical protein